MKYTWTPNPQLRDLLTPTVGFGANHFSPGIFGGTSTENLRNLLLQITQGGPCSVLFPDYICNSFVEGATKNLNVERLYYPIDENFDPQWERVPGVKNSKALFVFVHYFGKHGDLEKAAHFCEQRGYWLVEDGAHVFPFQPSSADVTLFSPHKLLAVPSGAIMYLKPDLGRFDLAEKISPRIPTKWLAKMFARHALPDFIYDVFPSKGLSFDLDPAGTRSETMVSTFNLRQINLMVARKEQIIGCRRENWDKWKNFFRGLAEPAFVFRENECPYMFGLRFESGAEARATFDCLNGSRVLAQTWPDLPRNVCRSSAAWRLRHRVLFFPVHQDLDFDAAAAIVTRRLGVRRAH